jgi:hypothetical protein
MTDQTSSDSVEQPKSEGGHHFLHPRYKDLNNNTTIHSEEKDRFVHGNSPRENQSLLKEVGRVLFWNDMKAIVTSSHAHEMVAEYPLISPFRLS